MLRQKAQKKQNNEEEAHTRNMIPRTKFRKNQARKDVELIKRELDMG